jgi:hypothetical protein
MSPTNCIIVFFLLYSGVISAVIKMAANLNQPGPTVRYKLPSWPVNRIKILLAVDGHPEYNSQYTLAYGQ